VVEEFGFSFANGITAESCDVSDESDAVMSDGEGEETGNVPLVAFVESVEQQPASRLVGGKVVLDGLTTSHGSSMIPKGKGEV